ncbi:MAG: rod shape-determining protein [Burkholderiaceae bacterium]
MLARFSKLNKHLALDLSIDPGTANTVVGCAESPVLFREPSVVAVREHGASNIEQAVTAVGQQARDMIGRAPGNLRIVHPIRAGVIADLNIAQEMLRRFFQQAQQKRFQIKRPTVVVAVPGESTQVERRAIQQSILGAGAGTVAMLEAPTAAAIGAGLPVSEAAGSMIVDIGAGTTEVGLLSLSGLVAHRSIRIAGNRFDEAITQFVRRHFGVLIGEQTAEAIKLELGAAFPTGERREMEVNGRSLNEGIPRSVRISSNEVLEALSTPLGEIVASVKQALEETPPELSADLSRRGIMLCGGSAQLREIDKLLMEETGLSVLIADAPESCVARGCAQALAQIDVVSGLFATE